MKKIIEKLKVSQVIWLLVSIGITFSLIVGGIGYSTMRKINDNLSLVYKERLVPIASLTSIRADFLNVRIYVSKGIVNYNKDIDVNIKDYEGRINNKLEEAYNSNLDSKESEEINKFKNNYLEFIKEWEKAKESLEKGQKIPAEENAKFDKLGENMEDSLKNLKDYEVDLSGQLKTQCDNIYSKSLRLFILIFSIGILILITISTLIIKMINKTTKDTIEILDKVAEGDFTVNIQSSGNNEFEIMKKSLNHTVKNISQMIGDIKENSLNIDKLSENLYVSSKDMSSSAENVSTAIQDIAKGTGEQAGDLVSITGILNSFGNELESMVSLIKEIDTNTKDIHSMANTSNDDMSNLINSVEKVSNAFEDLIYKISNVGENVNKITEITEIINGISEQTNLLALNAAIEAARAGESGKGFSVVADEIRKLAEQSRASLENINKLINTISMDTNTMIRTTDVMRNELVNQKTDIDSTIQSFTNITKAVDNVNPKINSVALSATKIDNEKNQILQNIEAASAIAEEVSASSEEIAASSEEMSASTEEVSEVANKMKFMVEDVMGKVNKFKTF